jgi:uncharacterized protein HemY
VILSALGGVLYRAGRWKDALGPLQEADRTRPGNVDIRHAFWLAMAYWRLGDRTEARQWFEKGEDWLQ